MTCRSCKKILIAGAALSLAACGGGGQVNSMPVPVPAPTPAPKPSGVPIIGEATTSQEFALKGATGISLADSDQLHVRYDAAADAYEVRLPSSETWERLSVGPNPGDFQASGLYLHVQQGIPDGYDDSALAYWTTASGTTRGAVAFGIPTPAAAVPTTGSATYAGTLFGQTTETYFSGLFQETVNGDVLGSIGLSFNFGAGTLSGKISPTVYLGPGYELAPMQFTNTVYSTGSSTFSGTFDSALSGENSFSGLFTGPAANELIGNFAFPYTSPVDAHKYEATGAFVAKNH